VIQADAYHCLRIKRWLRGNWHAFFFSTGARRGFICAMRNIIAFSLVCFSTLAAASTIAPVSNSVGILAPGAFVPPPSTPGVSGWLSVAQIQQETNLCVPTSAAMVLGYYGHPYPPRELKVWSRGLVYDPTAPFNDFTITFFKDLLSGLQNHGIVWTNPMFTNDQNGFNSGLQLIENQIDLGKPVIVDTDLYTGHAFVIDGYDNTHGTVIVADPFTAPPGIREIDFADFMALWNSSKVGSNIRGLILTTSP
jgi:hypothetical protein